MNKLLLILVIAVFLVVGTLIFTLGGDDEPVPVPVATSPGPAPSAATNTSGELSEGERDTYVNTIQTIQAQYRDLERRFQALVEDQQAVAKTVPTDTDINRAVGDRVAESADDLSRSFTERLNALKAQVEQRGASSASAPPSPRQDADGSPMPKGLGFDDLLSAGRSNGATGSAELSLPGVSSGWSTVMPMGTPGGGEGGGAEGDRAGGLLGWYAGASKAATRPVSTPGPAAQEAPASSVGASSAGSWGGTAGSVAGEEEKPIPIYTIPRNATLFSNDTLTALLGVIPVEGSILDPIRFKIITGNTNLATNGLVIPGVQNIVWSGIAIGNREMSCVRGELYSVTFTFQDGTIRTVSSNKNSTSSTKGGNKRILGYISDRQGSPCLKGRLITNAADYLRDRMFASGAAATADAFSQTQETTVTTGSGSVAQYFTGDAGQYIGAKALGGSLTELTQYLRERARNAVDLVFLEAGQEVVLHVEHEIDIDYDPHGRKLEHEIPTTVTPLAQNSHRLD